ncbi:AAA family ATPase [Candidatus Palauibacter sp.]|uniref:AAA family ATPase n=1 Tax=Candidatus Palauibacter sp. TaxID=3101350 RepID=UPI003B51E339
MLARAQVQLGTTTGAKIPLVRHGEGTQSLAVLMLFSAFREVTQEGAAVLALEEPEAHLHPSARSDPGGDQGVSDCSRSALT